MAEHMSFDPVAMEYYPTIWFNEFWLLRDYLIPMNETVTEVPLTFTLTSMSLSKFSLMSQMDQAFSKQVSSPLLHVPVNNLNPETNGKAVRCGLGYALELGIMANLA